MKIGLFTDTYLPDINGVVSSIVTLKDVLEDYGHEVYVVTNHSNIFFTEFEDNVLRLPGVEIKSLYGYNLTNPLQIGAADMIKDWDLDIIHVHTEFGVGIFARAVAKTLSIPLISTYHTTYEDYTHYINIFGLDTVDQMAKKMVAQLSKTYTKTSEIVIAPSQKTKEMLEGYDIKNEILVIPTGLNLNRFSSSQTSFERIKEIKDECQIQDEMSFVYIGRVAKEKSIDMVIDAFSYVKAAGLSARLTIVGSGPELPILKEQVEKLDLTDYVYFTGAKRPEEIPAYYHAHDAFISASQTETQGMTYIEALASGLPVFAYEDDVLLELIEDEKNGYFFHNAEELYHKIQSFTELEDFKRMKQEALRSVEVYDVSYFYDRVIKAYQKAIDTYGKNN